MGTLLLTALITVILLLYYSAVKETARNEFVTKLLSQMYSILEKKKRTPESGRFAGTVSNAELLRAQGFIDGLDVVVKLLDKRNHESK